jgi:hypothetical protein
VKALAAWRRLHMKRVIAIVAIVLGACTPAEIGSVTTAVPNGGADPVATRAPAPTEAEGPKTFGIGDSIEVTGEYVDDVLVTVAKVEQKSKYGEYDRPKSGNVYLAVLFEYEAIEDGASYNPFDWQVFVDGTAVDNFTFVLDGPEPELHSGTLPKGRRASGWVVYEVPKDGQVLLSYKANMFEDAPTFEVVARAE